MGNSDRQGVADLAAIRVDNVRRLSPVPARGGLNRIALVAGIEFDKYEGDMDIREIARRAKVSTATVSRAINRVPTVDPQLAKRVWKVVEELGYYPNTQARALVSGRSRILGLIAVRRMIERRVDGVAILTFGMEESLTQNLRFRKVPLVFVDVGPNVPGVSNIRINYLNGLRQGVQHLAALRHKRIAFVTGPTHLKSALARRAAFEEAMKEIGLEVRAEFIVVGDHTMEGGMRALTSFYVCLNVQQPSCARMI